MSTLLDQNARTDILSAQRLRSETAAVRVSMQWLGMRKNLTPQQKSQAADTFGAEGALLSAAKNLLDTLHPAFKAVTAVRNQIIHLCKGMSLPYPEPGIRLIRQDRIEPFDAKMREFREELNEAVWQLDEHDHELESAGRNRLGQLFNSADYPDSGGSTALASPFRSGSRERRPVSMELLLAAVDGRA